MTLTTEQLHRFAPACEHPKTHAAALSAAFTASTINSPLRLALLHGAVILVLGFWFGERALKNLGLDLSALLAGRVKP